jgi:hypothetical protein
MNGRIFGAASAVGLIGLIAIGVFAMAGGFGGDDSGKATTAREAACIEGSECHDTDLPGGDAASGDDEIAPSTNICIAPEEGGDPDCNDGLLGGPIGQTCTKDNPECNDSGIGVCASDQPECTPSDGASGSGSGSSSSPPGLPGCPEGPDVCEANAIDAAKAALAATGFTGATTASAKYVEWPDACMGVSEPDIACADVITPGYIVILDTGVLAFEYHTDLAGNAVLAEPAQ